MSAGTKRDRVDRRLAKSQGKEFLRSGLLSSDPITVDYCETWACIVRVFAWGVSRSRCGWFDMYMCRSSTQARFQSLGFPVPYHYSSPVPQMKAQAIMVIVVRSVSARPWTLKLSESAPSVIVSTGPLHWTRVGIVVTVANPSLIRHWANANCRPSLSIKRLTLHAAAPRRIGTLRRLAVPNPMFPG